MKKLIVLFIAMAMGLVCLHAQTKVFKEVSEDIASQIKIIRQDNALVGYVVFTRLEKSSADSFNYRLTIMDENLNDIGTVNFKEKGLILQSITFENDVLCLAYVKSNVVGNTYSKREYKDVKGTNQSFVLFQFVGLNGKIIKTSTAKVNADVSPESASGSKITATSDIKFPPQLSNIAGKGFVCFYGDDSNKNLVLFSTSGEQLWQKKISEDAELYFMRATPNGIYLLTKHKQDKPIEGGFVLLGYNVSDGSSFDKFKLQDKQNNDLKVLAFDNDPLTNNIYLSGNIINMDKGNQIVTGRQLSHGPYSGVFTINVNGPKKTDVDQLYSYWSDGSQKPSITERGFFEDSKSYVQFEQSFKDFDGNTYFAGSGLVKKTKVGSIVSSIVLAPLVLPSIAILGMSGTAKTKLTDVVLIKQNPKGLLYFDNSVPIDNTSFFKANAPIAGYDTRNFYRLTNSQTKANYLIIDNATSITIYNAAKRQVVRTIPHKEGQIKTDVYPAKEGYIMVGEYNKKEKYTRFSIEAL